MEEVSKARGPMIPRQRIFQKRRNVKRPGRCVEVMLRGPQIHSSSHANLEMAAIFLLLGRQAFPSTPSPASLSLLFSTTHHTLTPGLESAGPEAGLSAWVWHLIQRKRVSFLFFFFCINANTGLFAGAHIRKNMDKINTGKPALNPAL